MSKPSLNFRAYNKKNLTGLHIEATFLLGLAWLKFWATLLNSLNLINQAQRAVSKHNKQAKMLVAWRHTIGSFWR